jgi:hypothetical protein
MDDEDPKPPKKARKGRVRKARPHVAVRLEQDLVDKIDAIARELGKEWLHTKRSDALRMLLIKGVEVYEAEKAARRKGQPDPTT